MIACRSRLANFNVSPLQIGIEPWVLTPRDTRDDSNPSDNSSVRSTPVT